MRSKVILGHPKWPTVAILSKMTKKYCIDMKWPEMRSKVNFGQPKRPFCQKFQKYKKFRIDLKFKARTRMLDVKTTSEANTKIQNAENAQRI